MPRYKVTVEYMQLKEEELSIYAKDTCEAMQRAEEIVGEWPGIELCEATDCVEERNA